MAGNDDLIARLRKKALELLEHRHATAGWLMQEAATALAERDATIERLTKERDEALADLKTAAEDAAYLLPAKVTAERERDEARAEVVRLKEASKCRCEVCRGTGEILKSRDAVHPFSGMWYTEEYSAQCDECRGRGFVYSPDQTALRNALRNIIKEDNWHAKCWDKGTDPHYREAPECDGPFARAARAALTAKGGENAEG